MRDFGYALPAPTVEGISVDAPPCTAGVEDTENRGTDTQ